MPNIQDHVIATGHQTMRERPFDKLDSLILTQIAYMPMEGFWGDKKSASLKDLWAFLNHKYPNGYADDTFQHARYVLTGICAERPRYAELLLHDYENIIDTEREMQFAVCCFDLPDQQTYIAFRGTDWTLVGWKEDFNMSFMTVPSQREAVRFTEAIAAQTQNALLLGGHSKGGNLSVFAGAQVSDEVQKQIHRVYSFDGPGVDKATLHSERYRRIASRIESYLPQSSVVGMLLYYHPVYTVVRSSSRGILQHDALSWQVVNGDFETVRDVDFLGKLTNEALHSWLKELEPEDRRLLVDTFYQVIEAAQADTLDALTKDWHESALRMIDALRDIDPNVRRSVMRMFGSLFTARTVFALRKLLPDHLVLPWKSGDNQTPITAPKIAPNSDAGSSPAPPLSAAAPENA